MESDFFMLPGVFTHVYGPAASGKTNLALVATVESSKNGKVIYIDSENGFSPERLRQISKSRFNSVLENLIVIKPSNFDEQRVAVDRLEGLIVNGKISLVVIDTIGKLYRLEEKPKFRKLGNTVAKLLRISKKYKIPVLMLNQVYTDVESNKIRPVGTDIYEHFCNAIVELEIIDNKRRATIRKHPSKPAGSTLDFAITESGIEPKS